MRTKASERLSVYCGVIFLLMHVSLARTYNYPPGTSPLECGGTKCYTEGAECVESKCKCREGYVGNGIALCLNGFCDQDANCHGNAVCIDGLCQCKNGYIGDGSLACEKVQKEVIVDGCGGLCHQNASCTNGFCFCDAGLLGDGYNLCVEKNSNGTYSFSNEKSCTYDEECHYNAKCVDKVCLCQHDTIGDGFHYCYGDYAQQMTQCRIEDDESDEDYGIECHENAECIDGYCQCKEGWLGDGIEYCFNLNVMNSTIEGTTAMATEQVYETTHQVDEETTSVVTTAPELTTQSFYTSELPTSVITVTTAGHPATSESTSTLPSLPKIIKPETCNYFEMRVNARQSVLSFPKTLVGQTAVSVEKCKNANASVASAYCDTSGEWHPDSIHVINCESLITNLDHTHKPEEAAKTLEILTSEITLTHEDVVNTIGVVENILQQNKTISKKMSSGCIGSLVNVAQSNAIQSSAEANKVLELLDISADKVEISEEGFRKTTPKVNVQVVKRSRDEGIGQIVKNSNDVFFTVDQFQLTHEIDLGSSETSQIFIPPDIGGDRVSFVAFKDPNIFIQSAVNSDIQVNSVILSATTATSKKFSKNITLIFDVHEDYNSEAPDGKSFSDVASCRFWKEDKSMWSDDGCWLDPVKSNGSKVVCYCNHLTSFAAIFDFSDCPQSIFALNVFTIVGCGLSAVCLICTIFMFIRVGALHENAKFRSAFLIVNLAISLLGLDIVILVSEGMAANIDATGGPCTAISVITHFFLISAFAWMNCEALNIYLAVVLPMRSRGLVETKHVIQISLCWGWLMPLVFIAIVAGVDIDVYKREPSVCVTTDGSTTLATCWMESGRIIHFVVIPAIIMLSVNAISYISVTRAAYKGRIKSEGMNTRSERVRETWKTISLSITVMTTVGVTWLLGFLVTVHIAFSYIFVILNTSQGCFLFILFVLRNKEARKFAKSEIANMVETTSSHTRKK